MTEQQVQPSMPGKIKAVYFILTLIIMGSFATAAIMISQNRVGYSVMLLVLAILLAGAGFSLKRRFMR